MAFAPGSMLIRGFLSGAVTASICYSTYQQLHAKTIHIEHQEKGLRDMKRFPYGTPVDARSLLHYTGHSVYYDPAKKQPLWVLEVLTKDSTKGQANRRQSNFGPDGSLPGSYSASNADYHKSGWSRGHMAAAGNFKNSQAAMDDTFLLTNIVPQDFDNNSGFWNRFETHCRDLTKTNDEVHVITGPLYKYNQERNGKRYVQYEVIGKNMVPVPTHLYKIIMVSNAGAAPQIAAFVVPNENIAKEEEDLKRFLVSLETVEGLTGFNFYPALNRATLKNLCSAQSCRLKNWKELELLYAMNNIKYAHSMKDLDNAMNNLKKVGIAPNQEIQSMYESKLEQLNSKDERKQRNVG